MTTVQEHLLRQAGAISSGQARDAGLSYRQIEHRVSTGEWLAVRHGVYRLAAAVPLPETGLWTALLSLGPDALLVEEGAVWWWGVVPEVPSCWIFVARSNRRGDAGLRVSRAFVDRRDQHRHRGIRVASRPWAVLTAAAVRERREPGRGIALIDLAKQTRQVRQHELQRAFDRHPRCWGSTTMRRLLARTGDGAHSELERLAVSLLRRAGVTGFHPNLAVRLPDGTSAEIDLAFPEQHLAVELDGFAFHASAAAFRSDVRRGNRLQQAGWTVRRFTWDDLLHDPDGFVATVVQLLMR